MAKHVYIIDTCVLLHDPMAVYKFQEHDLYLPLAVIDDLDEIKTRRDTVGWSAREVFRILDEFDENQLTKGVKVNESGGKLFIYNTEAPLSKNDRPVICRVNSDNAIIDACLHLKSQFPKRKVAIITKDTGLRVRALSWQCQAENYRSDLLEDAMYTGIRDVKIDTNADWENLWQAKDNMVDIKNLSPEVSSQLDNMNPNEFVFLKYGEKICPAMHKKGSLKIMKDKSNGSNHGKPEYKGIYAKNIEQRCAMEILADEKIPLVCLLGAAGTGKAQPLYSSILTPDGFKPMGDINMGETIIGGDGKPVIVIGVFPQGKKKVYKVLFSDDSSTECCEEHLWTVQNEYQRSKGGGSTLELREIMSKLKGHDGRKNYSIPITNVEFDKRELHLDPYALGLLIGDGGLTGKTPVFSTDDDELLFSLNKALPDGVRPVHKKESCDYYLSCGKKNGVNPLTCILRNLNLMGKNSWNKFIPYEYLHTSTEQRIALLQGLMDTDGTVDHRNGKHVTFSTVSEQLAEDVIWLVRSLGGVCKKRYKKSSWVHNGEKIARGKSINITINVPPEINPFRLERKKKQVVSKTKYKPARYITSITEVGETDCQCIMVDNDSHLYITDDFIITHNTLLSLAVSLDYIDEGIYDRIIVIKPLIPVGGKDIGALPGDKWEKLSAWLGPMRDNIQQLLQEKTDSTSKKTQVSGASFEELVEDGKIEVEAMAFIQGRSIPNSVVIVDECLVADSLIYTADGKLVKVQDVSNKDKVLSWNTDNQSFGSNVTLNHFSRMSSQTIKINTSKGVLECSPTHKMWVYENGSKLVKKEASKLNLDDLIPAITQLNHVVNNDLTEKEAVLLAMILTDGHISKQQNSIKIDMSKDQNWLKKTFETVVPSVFSKYSVDNQSNARGNMIGRINRPDEIKQWVSKHNLPIGNKSSVIEVPDMIWNAPISSVRCFVQSCFDFEGDVNIQSDNINVDKCVITLSTCSKVFAYQMQGLLLKFGIDSHIYSYDKLNNKHNVLYRVSIVGGYMCKKYSDVIGFSMERKQIALNSIKDFNYSCPYIYPKVIATDMYESLKDDNRWADKTHYYKSNMNEDLGYRVSRNKGPAIMQDTLEKVSNIAEKINYKLNDITVCSRINSITVVNEPSEVFDFEVENDHTFVVNGMVSSNCQNLTPREARMVVERCGKGSKIILLGDLSQVENPFLDARSCGLAHAVNGGRDKAQCGTVTLSKVERSELAAIASEIFKRPEARR